MVGENRSERGYHELLDATPAMIWAVGPDGGCTFVNRHALEFTGRAVEEDLGDGWSGGVHPEDRPRVLARYREAFDARQPFALEYRLRRHDGEYRHMVARGVVLRDERGRFGGYIGTCADVTEIRLAELHLQRGLALFQSTLDGLCSHIAVLDRSGRILLVNRAWRCFAERYRLPLADAGVGASYLEVCDRSRGEEAAEAAAVAAGIRDVLAGRRHTFQIEYPCHTPDHEGWFLLRASPLEGSEEAAVVLEHTNVTPLRLAERQRALYERRARDSQRLESLGVLAGGIAHDFNNLLTVILGNIRLVSDEMDSESPLRGRLGRVAEAAEQAARLTGQMLTYAGKGSFAFEPVCLSRIVRDMQPLLDSCLEGRGILELGLEDDLPEVEADTGQMRQVVLNLVINAAEALETAEGSVRIRTGTSRVTAEELAESFGSPDLEPGEYVVLEVADSGRGVDPEDIERLFEPFFSTKRSGRGLGLSVVLGIVRGHRAAIHAVSSPGAGTRFRVLMAPSPRQGRRPDERGIADPAPTVLLVDDDDDVREVGEAFLRRAGFRVIAVSSGRKAVEAVRSTQGGVAVAVVDVAMPEMNGWSTREALRRIQPGLPVLLVSGFSPEQAEERFPGLDATGLLRKPYTAEILVERVRALAAG